MYACGCMGMLQVLSYNLHNIKKKELEMYVMHDDSVLPISLHMTIIQDVGSLDHFPIYLEVWNHAI